MPRTLWKGAISFGLLHAPVSLFPASRSEDIDFDWLKRGTLQPVGYKRVVKETGKEVDKEDIVKGIKQDDGTYVILSDDEIKSANVKSTHTIDIVAFADAGDLSFLFFEAPYFVAPVKGGEKVYTLLREALRKTDKIGIALVVLHNKQHLAALIPTPRAIVLNTLRWANEVKSPDDLDLPAEGLKSASVKPKELEMAAKLIESMSGEWDPTEFKDTFREDIMALVKKKIKEGKAQTISEVKIDVPDAKMDEETDLADLLKQSLQGTKRTPHKTNDAPRKVPPPAARKSVAARARAGKTTH